MKALRHASLGKQQILCEKGIIGLTLNLTLVGSFMTLCIFPQPIFNKCGLFMFTISKHVNELPLIQLGIFGA